MESRWFLICLTQANEHHAHARMLLRLARMTSLRPEVVQAHPLMRTAKRHLRVAQAWIIAAKGEQARHVYHETLSDIARYMPARASSIYGGLQ